MQILLREYVWRWASAIVDILSDLQVAWCRRAPARQPSVRLLYEVQHRIRRLPTVYIDYYVGQYDTELAEIRKARDCAGRGR
jgi:hypothetical protein